MWVSFVMAGGLLFRPVADMLSNLLMWFVNELKIAGLILVVIFAVAASVLLFLGSYYLSLKINDKRGTALFSDDYVKIRMGRKERTVNYLEITDIKYFEIANYTDGDITKSGYKLEIKTKRKKLKIKSSLKELWEYRIKELKNDFTIMKLLDINKCNKYHTTLEDIYHKTKSQMKN